MLSAYSKRKKKTSSTLTQMKSLQRILPETYIMSLRTTLIIENLLNMTIKDCVTAISINMHNPIDLSLYTAKAYKTPPAFV